MAMFAKTTPLLLALLLQSLRLQVQTPADSLLARLTTVDSAGKATILNQIARDLHEPDPRRAIETALQAREIARAIGDAAAEADANLNVGIGYENLSVYDQTFKYYLAALALYEAVGDTGKIAFVLDYIGYVHWLMDNYDRATEYYGKSLALARQIEDRSGIARVTNHIGLIRWQRHDFDGALAAYQSSLEIARQIGEMDRVSAELHNIASVYQDQKRLRKALDFYQQALKVDQISQRKFSLASTLIDVGRVYVELGEFEKARGRLERSRRLALELKSDHLLSDNSLALSQLYKRLGQHQQALAFFEMYTTLRDSIKSGERHERIEQLQTAHLMEKKETEIKLLSVEKELQQNKIRTQRNWLIFTLSAAAIVLLSALALGIQYSQKTRAYEVLVRKNQEIVHAEQMLRDRAADSEPGSGSAGQAPDFATGPEARGDKYVGSALSDQDRQLIAQKLRTLMQHDKLYTEHDLTLNKMAERLEVSRTYVSQVVNQEYQKSFTNVVNEYRIQEARRMLSDEANRNFTIESIADAVGFNSTNVFNKAFKKYTGVTPSFYLNSVLSGRSRSA